MALWRKFFERARKRVPAQMRRAAAVVHQSLGLKWEIFGLVLLAASTRYRELRSFLSEQGIMSLPDISGLWLAIGLSIVIVAWHVLKYAMRLAEEREPKIELVYRYRERPFENLIPSARVPIRPDKEVTCPATFFSIRLINSSETQPLRSVHIELDCVETFNADLEHFEDERFSGPLPLQWALLDGPERWTARDVPPRGERLFNVISVDEATNRVWIKSANQWQTNAHLFRRPGVYRVKVIASPIEGAPASMRLLVRWTGEWRHTEVWPVDEENPDDITSPSQRGAALDKDAQEARTKTEAESG